MTYIKPELLLVGAAQNLVLISCAPEDGTISAGRDNFMGPITYDEVDLW